MNNVLVLCFSMIAGGLSGVFFFGGLWWTIKKMPQVKTPALLFLVSFIVRMFVVLAVFYYTAGGDWQKLLCMLAGLILARILVIRLTRNHAMSSSNLIRNETKS